MSGARRKKNWKASKAQSDGSWLDRMVAEKMDMVQSSQIYFELSSQGLMKVIREWEGGLWVVERNDG